MQTEQISTPFGRRSMTLGMLADQMLAGEIAPDRSVDKWKIFRALCEARPLLGITDRALAVLNALLSFYPKADLSRENGLVVFPSNMQLSLRAHGMAEQTIRRHLAVLVAAGLLIRKDSPNGKRYARRSGQGEVSEAYGFSIAPLLSRADEIEQLAATVIAERLHLQRLREQVSLCRRDIAKLIETAIDEGVAGDWEQVFGDFRHAVESLPRTPGAAQLQQLLDRLSVQRRDILKRLETLAEAKNPSGNPYQTGRHIQNSKPNSLSELEPSFEPKQAEPAVPDVRGATRPLQEPETEATPLEERPGRGAAGGRQVAANANHGARLKSFPLGLVLRSCPEIGAYGPGGQIGSWRDLMAAAVVVRATLGVSPSAYEEACTVMGPENAATVIACILERGGHIASAGGYLRDLTRRANEGAFAIGPMLMSLARTNAAIGDRVG